MNLYDVANDREYAVNIKEHKFPDIQLNVRCIAPFAVKNASFPRWIEAAVGDEEGALFGDVRNEEHLSILFQPKMVIVSAHRSLRAEEECV